jgi:RimJ/RimL family protein N-acetyltransferase
MAKRLANYRNLLTLGDGTRVLLRMLEPGDRDRLEAMFVQTSTDDMGYMRDNVKDPAVIQRWIDKLDFSRIIPLVAVVNDDIVGDMTLHLGNGPYRHRGEVRVFLARPYRQRGLGTAMLKLLIETAKKLNLHLLTAEIVAQRTSDIRAFQGFGFQLHTILPSYFKMPDGETCDVALLILPLVRTTTEF